MPEAVLDVVAEDPQVDHVPEDVHPAAVEELAREDRRPPEPRRDQRVRHHELLEQRTRQRDLVQEHQSIDDDEADRDDRDRARRDDVAEREHLIEV